MFPWSQTNLCQDTLYDRFGQIINELGRGWEDFYFTLTAHTFLGDNNPLYHHLNSQWRDTCESPYIMNLCREEWELCLYRSSWAIFRYKISREKTHWLNFLCWMFNTLNILPKCLICWFLPGMCPIKCLLHGTHVMPIGSIPLLPYKPIDEYGFQEYKMWIASCNRMTSLTN